MDGRRDHGAPAAALALAVLALTGSPTLADEARVVDAGGRVLTVGNWSSTIAGGVLRDAPDKRVLGWRLKDGPTLLISGRVPGTSDLLLDGSPALSRNPVTGQICLAWSRESPSGVRDVVLARFVDNAWFPDVTVPAISTSSQVDPALLSDPFGRTYLAWRELDAERRIRLLVLDDAGAVLDEQELSEGMSRANGPPRLGLDAHGSVFAAFFGVDWLSGEARLFVRSAPESGGAVLHVPNPVIELGRQASLPAPGLTEAGSLVPSTTFPPLHVTVLSGLAVAWWTRPDGEGGTLVHHVSQTSDAGWDGSRSGTIALEVGTAEASRQALELLEAAQRRPASPLGTLVNLADRAAAPLSRRR